MAPIGKWLIITGLVLIAAGLLIMLSGKAGWLGRLPGDIVIRRERFTFYFPLATSLLISLLLTLLLWLFRR